MVRHRGPWYYPASNDPSSAIPTARRLATIGDCIGKTDPIFPQPTCQRLDSTWANHPRIVIAERVRQDGRELDFRKPASGNVYTADADVADRLERLVDGAGNTTGWKLTVAADDSTELYNASGRAPFDRGQSWRNADSRLQHRLHTVQHCTGLGIAHFCVRSLGPHPHLRLRHSEAHRPDDRLGER